MLKHEAVEEQPAAQVRVTAQELAEAVAAVEARKDLTRQTTDTIMIGEAVQQLGLNVSPEDLLAEIRAKQIRLAKIVSERRARLRRRGLVALGAVLILSVCSNLYFLTRWAPLTTASSGSEFIQSGVFHSVKNQEGDVNFPAPYSRPPNIELNGPDNTIVTSTRADGFHWKNPGGSAFDDAQVSWRARGMQ